MVTKQEIRKTLSEVKAIDKTFDICIADCDLREMLCLKMMDKLDTLIRIILKERKLTDFAREELTVSINEMNNHVKITDFEREIYFDECFKLHACIDSAILKIGVFVLDKK